MYYFGYFFLAFISSLLLTFFVAILMRRLGIVDRPKTAVRKIHKKSIPLGGGLAIFLSFFLLIGSIIFFEESPIASFHRELIGIFIGSLFLMIGGILDDRYALPAIHQLWFPVAAVMAVLWSGIGPTEITNPFGGVIRLDQWELSFALVFFWLMGMMFTTKLLDGLDGLATGIVAIGALTIFFLSLQPAWYQPEVALLAVLFGGACLGFLVWNFH
ncbi:MAG: MraY family glycosyltransferase, partial [Patescibacteria group bacterium]